MSTTWIPSSTPPQADYTDIRYEKSAGEDGSADRASPKITIDRPEVRNAFRPQTVIEISQALEDAREDTEIGVIILTGEGPRRVLLGRRSARARRLAAT